MDGSIVLGSSQRKRLLEVYRGSGGKELHHPQVRLRAHVILFLSEGYSWALIAAMLFCSTATIARWRYRFEAGGVDALLQERRGRAATLLVGWALVLVGWVKQLTPRDFGCCRGSTELAEVQRGFFVAFGYSRDAEQECAAFHERTGRIIKLLTVQEIRGARAEHSCDAFEFSRKNAILASTTR